MNIATHSGMQSDYTGNMQLCMLHIRLGQLVSKFEIEKYTVSGKLILPKKMERHFLKIFLAQLAFKSAWVCKYLQASCIQLF